MDVDDENIVTRQCYKLEKPIYDNLNLIYTSSNSMIVLWNKYQIFLYENFQLESAVKIIVPDFQLQLLIASNNYLVCLDSNGNLHLRSLKFKNSAQKILKIPFEPRNQGIQTCIGYNQDYILCLKYEADTYFLYLYKVTSNFQVEKIIILLTNNEQWPIRQNPKGKYLMVSQTMDKANIEPLTTLFKVRITQKLVYDLLVISFDNFSVYGCLFSPKMEEDEITLVKLYSCPAEICNLDVVNLGALYLIIALKMGTVIRLCFNDISKSPDIVHLNTSLHKTLALKDCLIYTDGVTMSKSENTFSDEKKLAQFFIKDAYDFVKCGDQIVCTTFTKLLYSFSLDDRNAVIIPENKEEFCLAEKILNNNEFINNIFKEVEKNCELLKKLGAEQDYICALGLANKQDVVKKAIQSTVLVFENYEEIQNKTDLILTEEMQAYFVPDTWLFLIRISNSGILDILNKILSHLSEHIRIHIAISSSEKVLKTTTIKLDEPLKKANFLIPVNFKNFDTQIKVSTKLVVKIPGVLNCMTTWTLLYKEDKILNSEHFIKTASKNTAICLKTSSESTEALIQKSNLIQFGCLFGFTDTSLRKYNVEWLFYVKLPYSYKQSFRTDNYWKKHLNAIKSTSLVQKLGSEDFLDKKNSVVMVIGTDKLSLKIQNFNSLLEVSSCNVRIAFNMRNFFSGMLYNEYSNPDVGKEYIGSYVYNTIENTQRVLKNFTYTSIEDFLVLVDMFEKQVIGNLPL